MTDRRVKDAMIAMDRPAPIALTLEEAAYAHRHLSNGVSIGRVVSFCPNTADPNRGIAGTANVDIGIQPTVEVVRGCVCPCPPCFCEPERRI